MACSAKLFVEFTDYAMTTFTCHLDSGHPGPHVEVFIRRGGPVTITWELDERWDCEKHGLQDGSRCEACDGEAKRLEYFRTLADLEKRRNEGVPIPGVKIVGETRPHREKP